MRWLPFVALLSGCSFAFVQAPPENQEKVRYFDCGSSGGAIAADVTGVLLSGATALMLATPTDSDEGAPPASAPITFGAISAIYLASAVYGVVNGTRCNRAKGQLSLRIQRDYEEHARRTEELEREVREVRASQGCSKDADCKGQRVCDAAQCVSPLLPPANPSNDAVPSGPSSMSPASGPERADLTPPAEQPGPGSLPDATQDAR
jgi:hypothetical protein